MDREKVIKGLEMCWYQEKSCKHRECPYYMGEHELKVGTCERKLHCDAIALLKEQERKNGEDEVDKVSFGCEFVICVTSGEGFEKGKIYPLLGTNNGIHILRECRCDGSTETEPFDFVACSGGIGEGIFNNWDDSGAPSFEELTILNARHQITLPEVRKAGELE